MNVSWPLWPGVRPAIRPPLGSGSACRASRWSERFQHEGQVAAKPLGGDHASHRIEAHADLILGLYEARPEIFLRELRDALSGHGVQTSTSGLWRFFRRHRITRKKGRFTQLSKNGRM